MERRDMQAYRRAHRSGAAIRSAIASTLVAVALAMATTRPTRTKARGDVPESDPAPGATGQAAASHPPQPATIRAARQRRRRAA